MQSGLQLPTPDGSSVEASDLPRAIEDVLWCGTGLGSLVAYELAANGRFSSRFCGFIRSSPCGLAISAM